MDRNLQCCLLFVFQFKEHRELKGGRTCKSGQPKIKTTGNVVFKYRLENFGQGGFVDDSS